MFAQWKRKLEAKKAKEKAIAESGYWKNHAMLQECLQRMRGMCTLAPMQMHEAVIAAVNIALSENTWAESDRLGGPSGDLLGETVYLVWDDEKLPVLLAPFSLICENIMTVRAVSCQCFLVSQTLDRIIWFDAQGKTRLYSIA